MNTPTDKHENVGVTGQNLSGSRLPVSLLRKIAADLRRTHAGNLSAEVVAATVARSLQTAVRVDDNSVGESVSLDPQSPMARISEVITREVRMFRRAGDDLLEVVLTPDAKTQISLRLEWRDGLMEAQARCDLGDYRTLNTQWPQLQATLAEHGVRLAHLRERLQTGFTDYFNNPDSARSPSADRRPSASPADKSPASASVRDDSYRKHLWESRL